MSHNVVIDNVKIKSVDALRMAVKELKEEGANVTLNEDRKTFRTWRGQRNECDMVIELPTQQFDVGLVKQPDGSYAPVFDHMLDMNREIACPYDPRDANGNRDRATIGKLMQRYATCATELEMAMAGHSCTRAKGKNGEIEILVDYAA